MDDMHRIPLHKLSVPYRSAYQHGRWDLYARSLERDGVQWLMEGRHSRTALHLQPLLALRPHIPWPPRLAMLQMVVDHGESVEQLEKAYHILKLENDHPALAAVASRALVGIWRSGNRLHRMLVWDERAQRLALESLQPDLAASLFSCRALTALLVHVDVDRALALVADSDATLASSDVHQDSIALRNTVIRGLALSLRGQFEELAALLEQSGAVAEHKRDNSFLLGYLDLLRGIRGLSAAVPLSTDASLGGSLRNCCQRMGFSPARERFQAEPPNDPKNNPQYESKVAPQAGDQIEPRTEPRTDSQAGPAEPVADDPSRIPVDTGSPHPCFFLHAYLGIYCFRMGQPARGLAHAQAALARGVLSQSPLARAVAVLPQAQCLIALGRAGEARGLLEDMIAVWQDMGLRYLAGCGALELAALYADAGNREKAVQYYDQGKELCGKEGSFTLPGRTAGFVDGLRQRLFFPAWDGDVWGEPATAPLRVVTLGDFALYVHGRRLYDRTWPHSKAKMLLKALIVLGGCRVAKESLLDLIWPEAEGDQAASNLKMTTSRLRKIVDGATGERLQWLVVAEGHLSLVKALCCIDALCFSEALRARLNERTVGRQGLAKVLNMYTGDFLPHNAGPPLD